MSTSEEVTQVRDLEPAVQTLLARFPESYVVALNDIGTPVPMPDHLPVNGHRPVSSTFDVVVQEDQAMILDLFGRARTSGASTGAVHLIEDPDQTVSIYMIDCRQNYGVLLAVIGDRLDESTDALDQWEVSLPPPRLARAHKDGIALYTEIDDAFTQMLGWTPEQVVGERALEFIHPDDCDTAIANWVDMLAAPGPGRRARLRHRHADGRWIWLEIANVNRIDDPEHGDVVADMVDISEEMAAHEAIRAREQLLTELAQTVPLGLFHADQNRELLFVNQKLHDILGVAEFASLADLVTAADEADRHRVTDALTATMTLYSETDLEFRFSSQGDNRYGALRLRALVNPSGVLTGIVGCLEDVTDGVVMRKRLEIQATYDSLTGCHNRASAMRAVSASVAALSPDHDTGLAVIYIDIDQFKAINDAYGHPAGDLLLKVVAERLRQAVRNDDVVGRIGGDEFVVICARVGSPSVALHIAETIAAKLCTDTELGDNEVPVRASIGVAWTDEPELDGDLLVASADAAMYASKHGGHCQAILADAVSTTVRRAPIH